MKNLILSVELASAVLGLNVAYIESCDHKDNIIGIWTDMNAKPIKEISIYEFVHMCKEWAFNKGYPFNVLCRHDYWDRCELKYDVDLYNHRKSFCSDIEVEAIINACNWILEDLKEKI